MFPVIVAFSVAITLLVILSALTASCSPQDTVPVTADSTPPGGIPGDGTFVVGTDIRPGKYRTPGAADYFDTDNCYWARLTDTSGDLAAVTASGNTGGPVTVTILPTDHAFETSGCRPWAPVKTP